MNRLLIPAFVIISLSRSSTAMPQSGQDTYAQQLLASARTVRCSFTVSVTTRLDSVPLRAVQRASYDSSDIVFDQIDRHNHAARARAGIAASRVNVIAFKEALTFVEIAPSSGFPNVYTVFGRLAPGSVETNGAALLAVVSVHLIAGRDIIASQDFGRCRVVTSKDPHRMPPNDR